MKVLIIDCLTLGDGRRKFSRDFIGGGPKLIAGVLNQVGLKDLSIEIKRGESLLHRRGRNTDFLNNFDICLISAMTMDFVAVKKIVQIWRRERGKKSIIIGGPIANDPNLLKKVNANITVFGEGEKKLEELMKILLQNRLQISEVMLKDLEKVKGITYRFNNELYLTEPSKPMKYNEYNSYSNPKHYLKFISNYDNFKAARIYIECLRGCSNYFRTKFILKNHQECFENCSICREGSLNERIQCPANIPPGCGFCSTIHNFGFPKSRKSLYIIEEIKSLLKMGVRRLVLGGPDFLDYDREKSLENGVLTTPIIPPEPNYNSLEELIYNLINLHEVKDGIAQIFIENVKASLCTEKALDILSKIPQCIFSIGCETGSVLFSKMLGRPFNPLKTLEVVKNAILKGIRVQVYFIHGLPGEEVSYLKESMDLIKEFYELGVEKITSYRYQEFPGAPFYLLQNKEKLLKNSDKILNKYRSRLKKLAISFNKRRKEEMVGNAYRCIIAELDFNNKLDAIGYIIKGGPKVLVKNASHLMGKEVIVRVQRALSDKFVEGKII